MERLEAFPEVLGLPVLRKAEMHSRTASLVQIKIPQFRQEVVFLGNVPPQTMDDEDVGREANEVDSRHELAGEQDQCVQSRSSLAERQETPTSPAKLQHRPYQNETSTPAAASAPAAHSY